MTQIEPAKYMVAWMQETEHGPQKDHYRVFTDGDSDTNLKDAQRVYNEMMKYGDTYSCNLCLIVQSTDYTIDNNPN